MPGPTPKPINMRQRRNKKASRTTLEVAPIQDSYLKMPPHPTGQKWKAQVLDYWKNFTSSPVVKEYLVTDLTLVYRYCILYQDFLQTPTPALSGELRMLERELGMSPLARLRLEWQVEVNEELKDKKSRRKPTKTPTIIPHELNDPRDIFQQEE